MATRHSLRLHSRVKASEDAAGSVRRSPRLHPQIHAGEDGAGVTGRRRRRYDTPLPRAPPLLPVQSATAQVLPAPGAPSLLPPHCAATTLPHRDPTPPPLPNEILEDIFLRLPPEEPACLVRASLTSKLWLGILTSPRFTASYRNFHRSPPMLGFCPVVVNWAQPLNPAKPYFSTTKFAARIPEDEDWNNYEYRLYDCRHGRVLLERHDGSTPTLILWNPMTGGCRRVMRPELYIFTAAVLCHDTGCDHRACHKGPSLVVSIGIQNEDDALDFDEFIVRTWSSEKCVWSEPGYCPHVPRYAFDSGKPSVLIGDTLYFMIMYPVEDEDNHLDHQIVFLMYHLHSSTLSMLDGPPPLGSVNIDEHNYIHMAMEDGNLGFAHVDNLAFSLFSRQMGSDTVEPWNLVRVIDLNEHLPIPNPSESLRLLGSVEARGIIFVTADLDVYEVDLTSQRWKKLCKRENIYSLIPYMSFYNPPERASSNIVAH